MNFWTRTFKELLYLKIPFVIIWAAVYSMNFVDPTTTSGLSPEQEKKLGDKIMGWIYEKEHRLRNPAIDSLIHSIEERFNLKTDSTLKGIRITVMQSKQVNAFALPGGNIVVLSGLIDFCDTPEEVAGVLAHEIGHIQERHVLKNITQQVGLAVLTSLIFNDNAAVLHDLVNNIIGTGFSRDYEEKADEFASKIMRKANLDPKHLADFLLRMELKFGGPDPALGFLSTHPANAERIESIGKMKMKSKEIKLNCPSWQQAKKAALSPEIQSDIF